MTITELDSQITKTIEELYRTIRGLKLMPESPDIEAAINYCEIAAVDLKDCLPLVEKEKLALASNQKHHYASYTAANNLLGGKL